jgi:predicted nucleic acid-binding protein
LQFDLARTLRRLKPSRFTLPLARRPAAELPFVGAFLRPGPELLLDTTVYIDGLQDRSPREVDALLALRVCNHSAVCLAELTHAFGRLVPDHPRTAEVLDGIGRTIALMRPHRLREPSQSAWGTAGILAGLAFRLGGYQAGQERRLLNDALVFLQALEHGQVVLTGNIGDFDILNQLLPEGRILLYGLQQSPNG